MSSEINMSGAIISILLPWLLGCVWVYCLLKRTQAWNWWLVIGHGYLLGLFVTTLVLRGWATAGITLGFAGVAITLSLLAVLGACAAWKLDDGRTQGTARHPIGGGGWLFCGFLLILLVWRYATILQEVLVLPLFPWDAWMNWAPKAIVWFHFKQFVNYVDPDTWLSAPANARDYTLGAYNAWEYPNGVPLIQLWSMLAIDTSDASVIYLPWVIVAIAMGCALYGHLRLAGIPRTGAMTGVYLLLSMPFVNVHSALAGYADLWVTVTFSCSVLAVIAWDETRQWQFAVIAILLTIFLAQLKVPGLIMAAIALAALVISLPRIEKRWLAVIFSAVVFLVSAIWYVGLDVTLPGIGQLTLSPDAIQVPYFGSYSLEYHPVHEAMAKTLFLMINWNILWYLLLPMAIIILLKPRLIADNFLPSVALLTSLGFTAFVYYFTDRYQFAEDFTQVNRAVIYSTPLLIFLVVKILANVCSRGEAGTHSPSTYAGQATGKSCEN
ncbi:hypothetical protein [Haliea sp. E17]|uniref:hypothetical protein n=1 Tax=Haliea sp. E17 TaxID=3401576 RepID=UPI003AAB04FC